MLLQAILIQPTYLLSLARKTGTLLTRFSFIRITERNRLLEKNREGKKSMAQSNMSKLFSTAEIAELKEISFC